MTSDTKSLMRRVALHEAGHGIVALILPGLGGISLRICDEDHGPEGSTLIDSGLCHLAPVLRAALRLAGPVSEAGSAQFSFDRTWLRRRVRVRMREIDIAVAELESEGITREQLEVENDIVCGYLVVHRLFPMSPFAILARIANELNRLLCRHRCTVHRVANLLRDRGELSHTTLLDIMKSTGMVPMKVGPEFCWRILSLSEASGARTR